MGERLDLLIPLNQDAMDRHLGLLSEGAACLYNSDTIRPGIAAQGTQLCPLPVSTLADVTRNKVAQNTLAVGAGLSMMGIGFQSLEKVLAVRFRCSPTQHLRPLHVDGRSQPVLQATEGGDGGLDPQRLRTFGTGCLRTTIPGCKNAR